MTAYTLRILESPAQMAAVEELQRTVWPGSETDIVPSHLLLTAAHNGGLVIGAYLDNPENDTETSPPTGALIGFVFGFTGLITEGNSFKVKHCSHMLGVHPQHRDLGLGFSLKRAQWQMVRHQGIQLATWTYDPLLSRNAHLNIGRLGGVCNTYKRDVYGEMRDGLNRGLPSDRFQVDWWLDSVRVKRRLSARPRQPLDLAHFLAAGVPIANPTEIRADDLPAPGKQIPMDVLPVIGAEAEELPMLVIEIPANFSNLRTADAGLALAWREHSRDWFETCFSRGYLVTDFIYLPGLFPRSFYVLTHGESTL